MGAGKNHPAELNAEATRLANLEGMRASGQPWQEDAAGASTAELLAVPHPDLVPGQDAAVAADSGPVVDAEPVSEPVVPAKVRRAKTRAPKKA